MADNKRLHKAARARNDEFYTQYNDIETEMNAYLAYDKDVFRGKTVLLPCDDPEWSNFTKYFAQNFERLGLKKLISTSYAIASKPKQMMLNFEPTEFEKTSVVYDEKQSVSHGKVFVLDRDTNKNGRIDIEDLELIGYLKGDGDFRSDEVKHYRDEADIIVTNPPFSLFSEFLPWIVEAGKQFAIIGNKNAITYKEIFPLIKENKMWVGATPMTKDLHFEIPKAYIQAIEKENRKSAITIDNGKVLGRSPSIWFANIEHGKRHRPLQLMTMAENLKYSKHKEIRERGYPRYDDYEAIEVSFTDAIPDDYSGVMGVPISFMDKYCPEQIEIMGLANHGSDNEYDLFKPRINGKEIFKRILIRNKMKHNV